MNPWGALFVASMRALAFTLAAAYLAWFFRRCVNAHRKGAPDKS